MAMARANLTAQQPDTSASPKATSPPSELRSIDVFGTRAFSAADVLRDYGPDIEAMVREEGAMMDGGAAAPELATQRRRVLDGLRRRGNFAYLDLSVTFSRANGQRFANAMLDVVERGDSARRLAFAPEPRDTVPDPAGLVARWQAYQTELMQMFMQGKISPAQNDCPVVHCLSGYDTLAAHSAAFARDVPPHRDAILRVLRRDHDPERRAAAAFLLGNLTDAQWVANALVPAVRDPAEDVRNNAMRVLMMLAQRKQPVAIPLDPLLAAIRYPGASDRNKAAYVLVGLANRPAYQPRILEDAGPVLLDMLELQQPNNHAPAYEILKKLSGRDFGERDYAAWRAWWRTAAGLPPGAVTPQGPGASGVTIR
jgi:hypothetical protein